MPNLIDNVYPNANILMDPDLVTTQRPELALAMHNAVAHWARAEAEIGRTLISILGPDSRSAVETAINRANVTAHKKLLLAHALALPADKLELLQVLLMLFGSNQRIRNRLVHWLCGIAPAIPDGIVLSNPTREWLDSVELEEYGARRDAAFNHAMETHDRTPLDNLPPFPRYSRTKTYVYKMSDFNQVRADTSEVLTGFWCFNWILNARESMQARGYDQLRALPRFLPTLERLRADQSSPPPAPRE
jgi:hypothetical protein